MTDKAALANDCFAHDRDMLAVDDALALLKDRLSSVVAGEMVPLQEAVGRILSEDVFSQKTVPPFDNSAVDGYAVCAQDCTGPMPVQDVIEAGDSRDITLEPGKAIRIMTGARVPQGTDTVVMLEDCETTDGSVNFAGQVKAGANIRQAGEDIQIGDCILNKGHRLGAADIGLLASLGIGEVSLFEPLRIALVSTGAEVRDAGTPLKPGQIYDVNRPMLANLYEAMGFVVTDAGILPDEAEVVENRLKELSDSHDVIVTSGGASMGDKDFIAQAVDHLGTLHGWRIAIKPGRPLGFGQITRSDGGSSVVLILPGNPVAAAVCSLIFARPALTRMAGGEWVTPTGYNVPAGFAMSKKPGRREYLRVRLDEGKAVRAGKQGSGVLTTMAAADGLLVLADDLEQVDEGDLLTFYPFSSFGVPVL